MSTSRGSPIEHLFPVGRIRLLALFMGRPHEQWHLRDVARRTGLSAGSVRRELSGLVDAEIVTCRRAGNRTYYRANPDSPIFPELSSMMRKTAGLADVVRDALRSLSEDIDLAFIYGSQARSDARAGSDVDLLVVGKVDELALHRAVTEAERLLGRPVNYTLLSSLEYSRRRKEKGGFLRRILAGERTLILDGRQAK